MANILYSREGLIQGEPLAMVAYGIGVLLLIKQLKSEYPDVTQPYYAEDTGSLSTFDNMKLYINDLNATSWRGGINPIPLKAF